MEAGISSGAVLLVAVSQARFAELARDEPLGCWFTAGSLLSGNLFRWRIEFRDVGQIEGKGGRLETSSLLL